MNLAEAILYQCKLNPWDVAICVPTSSLGSITYGRLEAMIHNVARTALSSDLRPREVVAIAVRDVIVHTALSLGLMRSGIATLPLHDGSNFDSLPVDAVVTDAPQQFAQAKKVLRVDSSWLGGDGRAPDYDRLYREANDDVARAVLVPAAGAPPKVIALSHGLLWNRVAASAFQNGGNFSRSSRFYCNLEISTIAGFRYTAYTLMRGGTVYFLGDDPAAILQYAELQRIEGMVTEAPGLEAILQYLEMDSAFGCRFDHVICQGGALSRELSERVRSRICETLFVAYGSPETGTIAFGPASALADIPGGVGYVGPGIVIEAVDDSGQTVPAGHAGVIRVRSPFAAAGYQADKNAPRTFRDGWFYNGDTGYVTADRLLVVTGPRP